MNLDVWLNDQLLATLSLVAAAHFCKLDVHEVEWAIEQLGRCDVLGELVLVPHGEGRPAEASKWHASL